MTGQRRLKSLPPVELELSFAAMYDGQALFEDVLAFMKEHHFDVTTLLPTLQGSRNGHTLQADANFK